MIIEDQVMDAQERIGFRLRELYHRHGYRRYRMSKFEEYDLYSRNKDFLFSDGVITFTDTNGRLMAMKPDVTLSIVKNGRDVPDALRKLYYHENVYRAPDQESGFREMTQVGVECMGPVDEACLAEVLALAGESLALCSERYVLEISQLDVLSAAVNRVSEEKGIRKALLACTTEKNRHGILNLCRENGLEEKSAEPLLRLISLYGSPASVLQELREIAGEIGAADAAEELSEVLDQLEESGISERVLIDFSATGDLKYYNGIAFKGFIDGIPGAVLSGGQYEPLMRRLGRKDRAIGFAVFLNQLERLTEGGGANA